MHQKFSRPACWYTRTRDQAIGTPALPSNPLGLCLSNHHFPIAVALCLGAQVSFFHKCVCGADAKDVHGNHALVCPSIKSRFVRHHMGNDVIRESLKTAPIPSILEPVGLLRNDDDGRPDGATITPWSRGKSQQAHYSDVPQCHLFQPVAVETLGGVGASTWLFLRDLSMIIESQTPNKNSFIYLRQRLAIAVQRGNGACVSESSTHHLFNN